MKFKPNAKATASFARNLQIMAHAMFVSVAGLSVWKGTGLGLVAAFLVWLVLQGFAWFLLSLSFNADEEDESG